MSAEDDDLVELQALTDVTDPAGHLRRRGERFPCPRQLAAILVPGGTVVPVRPRPEHRPAQPVLDAAAAAVTVTALVECHSSDGVRHRAGNRFDVSRADGELLVGAGLCRLAGERPPGWTVPSTLALQDGGTYDAFPGMPPTPAPAKPRTTGPVTLVALAEQVVDSAGRRYRAGDVFVEADRLTAAAMVDVGRARLAN